MLHVNPSRLRVGSALSNLSISVALHPLPSYVLLIRYSWNHSLQRWFVSRREMGIAGVGSGRGTPDKRGRDVLAGSG